MQDRQAVEIMKQIHAHLLALQSCHKAADTRCKHVGNGMQSRGLGRASCSSWLVTGASSALSKLADAAASGDRRGRGSLAAAESDDRPSL